MTVENLTSVLNHKAYTAAIEEFRMAYPHQNFPNAVRRTIALIYGMGTRKGIGIRSLPAVAASIVHLKKKYGPISLSEYGSATSAGKRPLTS